MKKDWSSKKLEEIANITSGNLAPQEKSLFIKGVHPFFRMADVGRIHIGELYKSKDKLNEKGIGNLRLFTKGSILIPKSGASTYLNHRVILGTDGYVANHLAVITVTNKQISNRYLFYYLITIKAQDLIQETKYPSLKISDIKNITIPIPPLPEQRRIVAVLDQAFEDIDQAIENTQGNLENIRELFQSSVENIFIREDGISEKKKLCDVCIIKPPKSEARKRLNSTDLVSFVPMKDLGICQKNFTASQVRSFEDVLGNYTYFAEEDVLIAKITPCFENGKLGIARKLTNGIGFGSSEFIVFRTTKLLFNEYLFYFISREKFRKEGAQNMSGAVGHKRVAKSFMDNYKIPLPPLPPHSPNRFKW